MEQIIAEIVFALLFVVFGWKLREWTAIMILKNMHEKENVENDFDPEDERTPVNIFIERIETRLYAYNSEHNGFMAQGTTFMELQASLMKNFPANKFIIAEDNLKQLDIKL